MAKIDPAFQAAPNLGASSHDPIAFARRNKMEKFQIQRRQKEEEERNTAKGLQNLMVDVKGWEDQQGFKEIMADQDRIMNGFLDLSKRGMNLVSPKTTQEIMAYKAINEAHQQLKQKADTWTTQKGVYDIYLKAIEKDDALPLEEQEIDHDATISNLEKVLKTKDILTRGNSLAGLMVTKPKPVDIMKDILANKDLFEKGTQSQNIQDMPDGSRQVTFTEKLTPQQTENNARIAGRLFESKPQSYKDAVKKIREADPDPTFNVMSDVDYYKTIAIPAYRKKFLNKPVGKGGSGFSLNFGGGKTDIEPAEHKFNEAIIGGRDYNDRWDISPTKAINFNINGGEYATGEGWEQIPEGGGIVEGQLLFYDPKSDALVFRSTQDAKNPWIKNNTNISIPRKNLANAEKIPVRLENGKIGTLKDVMPKAEPAVVGRNTVLKNSGISWQ